MQQADYDTAAPLSGLFSQVYRGMLAKEFTLPARPDVALRIRAAMQDPDYSVASIARAAQADAGTSAYLVRIANSALYRGATRVTSIDTAILRLGTDTTRNLVTSYALRAMFTTRSPVLASVLRNTWIRSARLAALAAVIAQRCGVFSRDRAMLAGLVQDIGVLPMIAALEKRGGPPAELARIDATLQEFAAKIGVILLSSWDFDQELVAVAGSRCDWQRDSGEVADLGDLLLVARLHACATEPCSEALPRIDQVPAFGKLPLGDVSDDARLIMLLEADSDVRDLTNLLGV